MRHHYHLKLPSTWPALLRAAWLVWAVLAGSAWAQTAPASAQAPVRIALIEGLSGPTGLAGEAVLRNLTWAIERINARGGINLPGGQRLLQLERFDSKGQTEDAISALRQVADANLSVVLQGNSSAVASGLIEAIERHNQRDPARALLLLNYSAIDPALTNERCSFWHFRFDAHVDMRLAALLAVLKDDASIGRVYLLGQDYSFGQAVLRQARQQLPVLRPDVRIVGEELHPMARVKDFLPYITKIRASGADAVITGNWGSDLTLLVKAAREAGYSGKFYTFYGNALGAPAAMGEAGVGQVIAVADWMPNVPNAASQALYQAFRQRFGAKDDYLHMRMQLMLEALVQAIERAGRQPGAGPLPSAQTIAQQLERADVQLAGQRLTMRAADHQAQQALVVAVMERQGTPGVPFDAEGSGYGFRVLRQLPAADAEMAHRCVMQRP